MKLSIEIEQNEVESMSKTATTIVESILRSRCETTKIVTESMSRTVDMICKRLDMVMELELARAATRRAEAERAKWDAKIAKEIDNKFNEAVQHSARIFESIIKKTPKSKDDDEGANKVKSGK